MAKAIPSQPGNQLGSEDLDALLRVSQDLLVVAGFDGYLRWANLGFTDVLGYDRKRASTINFLELIHPDDVHLVLGVMQRMAEGEPGNAVEVRARAADGSWRWFRSRTHAVGDRIYVSAIDITADHELAEQRDRTLEFLGRYTAAVSHDLIGPVTNIAMGVNSLNELLDEDPAGLLDLMARNVDRAAALIGSYLALNRQEDLDRTDERFSELVATALGDLTDPVRDRIVLHEKGVDVTVHVERTLACSLIRNLLTNAVRHGGPNIEIVVEAVELDTGRARIAIADDGRGVPEEERLKIFDWTHRSSTSVGFGLGLAMSRQIVEAHGGTIWVEDNHPRGARFLFTLPLASQAPDR
ncbi:MAG: PAS domain-containing sensor histidine kinase [Nitriliruptorales bacterium]|nr:PAS domain-containing sensor histidine kinase [Nitriliruptorales bacterium]